MAGLHPATPVTPNATPIPPRITSEDVRHSPADLQEQPFHVRKRIAVLGARGVGKSALSIQCALNRFERDYMLTFEATYQWKPVIHGVHYDVTIVDTDGQDENSFFGLQYTIGVDGYILMFSVRDETSFEVVKAVNDKLLDTLNVVNPKGTSEVPRILVGNQIDIPNERQVPARVAERYAAEQGIPYFETSACTSHNVTAVFAELLTIIQTNLRQSHTSRTLQPSPEKHNHDPRPSNNVCLVQ